MKENLDLFPKRLKEARERNKMTQEHMEIATGIARTNFSNWEHGRCLPNSLKLIEKVAKALGVSMEYLLGKDIYQQGDEPIIDDSNNNYQNQKDNEIEKLKNEILILQAKHEAAIEYFEAIGRGTKGNEPLSKTQ